MAVTFCRTTYPSSVMKFIIEYNSDGKIFSHELFVSKGYFSYETEKSTRQN